MSVDLYVHLKRSAMPTPAEWAAAIKSAGFDVDLDIGFDADTHTGFLPCGFRGSPSGFEYHSRPLVEDEKLECGIPKDYDFSVTFLTHANIREFATSLIAAGVLCQRANGQFVDPQSGDTYSATSVMKMVQSELSSVEEDLK